MISRRKIKAEFSSFFSSIKKQPHLRLVALASLFFLALLLPGQNAIQTIVLKAGPLKMRPVDIPLPGLAPYPVPNDISAPPTTAASVIVQDAESKVIMYSRNPDAVLLPASTTKIMTALVALDTYKNLDTVLQVNNVDRAIGHTMELEFGERMSVRNLLYGLLIESGNDAAYTLAINSPGGYDAFISKMNEKAKSLDLNNTTYRNVSGVESPGHVTTARDLATLASYAVQNPIFAEIVQTQKILIKDVSGTYEHLLENTNELLGTIKGLKGIKTGWTANAGECLVTLTEREGRQIIVVVLNSQDRFGDTSRLIEWAFANHSWSIPALP